MRRIYTRNIKHLWRTTVHAAVTHSDRHRNCTVKSYISNTEQQQQQHTGAGNFLVGGRVYTYVRNVVSQGEYKLHHFVCVKRERECVSETGRVKGCCCCSAIESCRKLSCAVRACYRYACHHVYNFIHTLVSWLH